MIFIFYFTHIIRKNQDYSAIKIIFYDGERHIYKLFFSKIAVAHRSMHGRSAFSSMSNLPHMKDIPASSRNL